MQPVGVEAHIGYTDKSTQRLVEGFALNNLADRRAAVLCAEVGVEHPLPHRDEEHHVPLLAGVLLGDLQFDCLVGVAKRGE